MPAKATPTKTTPSKTAKTAKAPRKTAAVSKKSTTPSKSAKAPRKTAAAKKTSPAKSKASSVEDDKTRYFKASDPKMSKGESFGRFTGKTPKQAASKAFTSLVKERAEKGMPTKGKIHFSVTETTRGGKGKVGHYVGERVKLNPPTEVKIGDKVIRYEYQNRVLVDKEANKAK